MGFFDDGPYEVGDENRLDPNLVPVPANSYLGESKVHVNIILWITVWVGIFTYFRYFVTYYKNKVHRNPIIEKQCVCLHISISMFICYSAAYLSHFRSWPTC